MIRARGCGVALLLIAMACAAAARSDPLEPPPETPEGADYEAEPADSIDADQIEVGFAASGRPGAAPRRTRRLRFSADSLGGTIRDGQDDPLAGGTLEGATRAGRYGVGRLAPRWGRGLLLGSPAEPWSLTAEDRGTQATFRGRAGEGAWLQGGSALRTELIVGRFARRSLAGLSLLHRGVGLGLLGDRAGGAQTSVVVRRGTTTSEWAIDRRGRWRAESAWQAPLGDWDLSTRVRGGHADFRSLAEPRRSGPAQALTASVAGAVDPARVRVIGALWRFRAGLGGARVALESSAPLADGTIAGGVEEQHGLRREPTSATGFRSGGFRQGWWSEWRGGTRALGLALRHEAWGARRLARDPIRTVTTVRVEASAWAGAAVRVTHAVFRVRRGESMYLPEVESDRLVLRAATGTGDRTRIELRLPAAGGMARASLGLSGNASGRAARPRWTLDWTRRSRLRRRG